MKILFISLGCDKNLADSEEMLGLLTAGGHEITDDETQADAIVIALKTRTQETEKAVSFSLDALHWLKRLKLQSFLYQILFYIDSTPKGNIGPVCDAAMDFLQVKVL